MVAPAMSRLSRDKGLPPEREIVAAHADLGIAGERVPLSGAGPATCVPAATAEDCGASALDALIAARQPTHGSALALFAKLVEIDDRRHGRSF